jgi:uncharacterized membrane protein YagU involved in acid resistance
LGESKSAVRFALALLEVEILVFKVFTLLYVLQSNAFAALANCSSAMAGGVVQGVVQAGSLSVFSLAHPMLSLPWLMELCWG